MICCMPFTYLSNARIETLTAAFGSLLIYYPMAGLVPDHMRTWSQRGLLDVRLPSGVDVAKLRQVIKDFKSWADLYRGDIGDLSAFLRFSQEGRPLVDETAPSQISTQIRRYGRTASVPLADPLFQSGLFLTLAHEYDQHQDAMSQEMISVHAMEQRMFAQIVGTASDRQAHLGGDRALSRQAIAEDPGQYMTGQRIHTWATLALTDAHPVSVYLTTSRAVFEHLQDAFPKASHVLQREIDAGEHIGKEHKADIRPCRQMFETLILAEDPATVALDAFGADDPPITSLRLTLNLLAGCRPRNLLARLLKQKQHIETPPRTEQEPINTLLALVELHWPEQPL